MDAKTHGSTERTITYSRETKDFDATLGGEYIGSFPTQHDAEVELDRLALALVSFASGWDAAQAIAASSEISASLASMKADLEGVRIAIQEAQDAAQAGMALLVNWSSGGTV